MAPEINASLAAAGSLGILIALGLILAAWLVLPVHERKLVRGPLLLLILHLGFFAGRLLLPPGTEFERALRLMALVLLLASIGRSGFLLVVHAFVARRLKYPLPKIFEDLIQIAIYLGVALITLRAAGMEPGSLLATSALLTAVIGLSLQDTLGNLFAGLAIHVQRPFEVGDWIKFDDHADHVGRVAEINWRATKLITLDEVEVIVPNGVLAKAPIENYTKPTPVARRNIYLVAPYSASPNRVRALLLQAICEVPGVLKNPAPSVVVSEFDERGVRYWIRIFIDDFAQRDVIAANTRERCWYALYRAGLEIPAPQRRIEVSQRSVEQLALESAQRLGERERALSGVNVFRVLPDEARRELARLTETRLYSEGEIIIRQGDQGEDLFIVERGEVGVFLGTGGREIQVAALGPGKFFGEMSLMTGEPRRATVRANTECEVLVVSKRGFLEIVATRQELLNQISEVLAARDDQLDAHEALVERPAAQTERGRMLLHRIREFFSL
jgi:small-conductance mechanosensitive channel/CRP-like cAMP-binding protein